MARTARIAKIDRRGQRCTYVRVRAPGYKNEIEIPGGMQEFRQWIRERLPDEPETLVALALAQWLAKNPGSQDFSGIEGKQITLDLDAQPTSGLVVIQ